MSSQKQSPKVSVLIPTCKRPQLLRRAIASVQTQTFTDFEIVVTVDGPDPATEVMLSSIDEPRLRWVVHPENRGLPAARLSGIKNSIGEWIAYLDDDDEWMPDKLDLQLAVAKKSCFPYPIVTSRLIGRTAKGDFVWPRRAPKPSEHISEYLFVRKSLFYGESLLQPSTWLVKRELLMETLPDTSIQRHEDWNWLLHAMTVEGAGIEFLEKPLSIWYREGTYNQLSYNTKWVYSLSWIRSVKHLVTPKAYAGFIMSIVGSRAALYGRRDQFWPLLSECFREGPPGIMDTFLYMLMWVVPSQLRTNIRSFVIKRVFSGLKTLST
ncbi:MAG: glycosyltransferase family 2 protein [Cyanobacteria bacterium P01_E01_bin.34]